MARLHLLLRALAPRLEPVGLLTMAAYMAVAWTVVNVFPFSVADMYATERLTNASIVVVRGPDARLNHVTDWKSFACDGPSSAIFSVCDDQYALDYLNRDNVAWIDAHPAGAGEPPGVPITIIRRSYAFVPGESEPTVTDCTVLTCRAVPR